MQFTLPKVGLRTIKSALSVFLFLALLPNEPFFACLTAIICLQDTVSSSIKMGINRALGTIMGATIGLGFMLICRFIAFNISSGFISKFLIYLSIAIGIIVVITSCNLVKKPGAVNVACIAFLGVTTIHAFASPLLYAVNRTFETLCGVVIAILVNKYITPPKEKHEKHEHSKEHIKSKKIA